MKSVYDSIVSLYTELLGIAEREREAIAASSLEMVEHYCSLKDGLFQKLTGLISSGYPPMDAGQCAELRSLIKQVSDLTEHNRQVVRNVTNEIAGQIFLAGTTKEAFHAYAYVK